MCSPKLQKIHASFCVVFRVRVLTTSQILVLTTSQIRVLTTSQIRVLFTTSQIRVLITSQIRVLGTSQLRVLTTANASISGESLTARADETAICVRTDRVLVARWSTGRTAFVHV